jgi:MFS family permease
VVLAVCFISGPVIYLISLVPYQWGIVTLLLIVGMIMYVRMPVSEAYILSHTSERHRSMLLAIYYFGSLEGGGVLAPVMGSLIDQSGFYLGFTVAGAAVLLVTSVCSLWLWGSWE